MKSDMPPGNPAKSQKYYDTTLDKERIWDGTTWRDQGRGTDRHYAGISIQNNASALSLTTQNTWYQVGFDTDGIKYGANPKANSDEVKSHRTADYRVAASVSVSGGASQTIQLQIKKNDGATALSIPAEMAMDGSGSIRSAHLHGRVTLITADTVELWARCTSAGAVSITVKHAVLGIEQICSDQS